MLREHEETKFTFSNNYSFMDKIVLFLYERVTYKYASTIYNTIKHGLFDNNYAIPVNLYL